MVGKTTAGTKRFAFKRSFHVGNFQSFQTLQSLSKLLTGLHPPACIQLHTRKDQTRVTAGLRYLKYS